MSEMTDSSNYGYTPSLSWSVAFITLFGVSALLHSYQAFRSKYWVAYPTLVLGCLIEIMGWSARLWSHEDVLLLTPFLMQICTLIMAPVFFSAFDYIILGAAIRRLGPQYSVLRPGMYFAVFLTADLISLVLQAVGGGQASASAGTSAPTQSATDIMVAGIIFQLISMGVFVVLGFDFIVRATSGRAYVFRERQIAEKRARAAEEEEEEKKKNDDNDEKVPRGSRATLTHVNSDETVVTTSTSTPTAAKKLDPTTSSSSSSHGGPNPNPNSNPMKGEATAEEQVEARENLTRWWIMLGGCLVSSIAIVIRGIYRSIELSAGWDSTLMHTEILQAILDGLMMVIAVGIFNVLNPLYLLPKRASWKGFH